MEQKFLRLAEFNKEYYQEYRGLDLNNMSPDELASFCELVKEGDVETDTGTETSMCEGCVHIRHNSVDVEPCCDCYLEINTVGMMFFRSEWSDGWSI